MSWRSSVEEVNGYTRSAGQCCQQACRDAS